MTKGFKKSYLLQVEYWTEKLAISSNKRFLIFGWELRLMTQYRTYFILGQMYAPVSVTLPAANNKYKTETVAIGMTHNSVHAWERLTIVWVSDDYCLFFQTQRKRYCSVIWLASAERGCYYHGVRILNQRVCSHKDKHSCLRILAVSIN